MINFGLRDGAKSQSDNARRFKIQRGKNSDAIKHVSEEKCYGVICYETLGDQYWVTEIILPILPHAWALAAAQIFEQTMTDPVYYAAQALAGWQTVEDKMRERGYSGASISLYHLPDAVGFNILEQSSQFATAQLENAAPGLIEKILTEKGYVWLPEERTWASPDGKVWQSRHRYWALAQDYYRLFTPEQTPPNIISFSGTSSAMRM